MCCPDYPWGLYLLSRPLTQSLIQIILRAGFSTCLWAGYIASIASRSFAKRSSLFFHTWPKDPLPSPTVARGQVTEYNCPGPDSRSVAGSSSKSLRGSLLPGLICMGGCGSNISGTVAAKLGFFGETRFSCKSAMSHI